MIKYLLFDIGIAVLIGYLFYRNIVMTLIVMLLCVPVLYLTQKKEIERKKKELLEEQFKDAILAMSASLRAGYSVENSFGEIYREMITLYGEQSLMAEEIRLIIKKLRLNVAVEELLEELGRKTDVEDIKNFASVFKTAKRSGGDMIAIITHTAKTIGDKFDMQREISTMLAAKRMEHRLMLLMPIAIMVYIGLFNSGFLDVLYETGFGRVIMSACLVVYVVAFLMGEKIVNIEI